MRVGSFLAILAGIAASVATVAACSSVGADAVGEGELGYLGQATIIDGGVYVDGAGPLEPCTRPEQPESRACGMCGTELRVCKWVDGRLVWLPWGGCNGEHGTCMPGTLINRPCGRCGFQQASCNSSCEYDTSTCVDAPGAECDAAASDWMEALSCPVGLGRARTCGSLSCKWGPWTDECVTYTHEHRIEIALTTKPGGDANVVTGVYPLPPSKKTPRPDNGACPKARDAINGPTPSSFVEVVNLSTTDTAKISVWQSEAPGGDSYDAVIGAYAGISRPPSTDDEVRRCTAEVKDSCTDCSGGFAGLVDDDGVLTLAPGASVYIYTARYSDSGSADDIYQLNVRTDSLAP